VGYGSLYRVKGIKSKLQDIRRYSHDAQATDLMAAAIERVIARRAVRVGQWPIEARDIIVLDTHVASGAALRRALRERGIFRTDLIVDTPEALQGAECLISAVLHLLSSAIVVDQFNLVPARLCVQLTRHMLGCGNCCAGGYKPHSGRIRPGFGPACVG